MRIDVSAPSPAREAYQLALFFSVEPEIEHSSAGYERDAFQAAFPTATQALQAAIDAQYSLCSEKWPAKIGDVRVRMALHTGVTEERGDDYVGPALNRVARLLSAGHGGQVLLTLATQQLLRDSLPSGVTLRDMGEHRLKDLIQPERIYQVVAEGLPALNDMVFRS